MINNEITHKIHKKVANTLHRLISPFGLYSKGHVNTDGYTFSVKKELDNVEKLLENNGFVRNPTAFFTYRKIDNKKNYTVGSWAYYPDGLLGRKQLHITLYSAFNDGFVDVYAHKEDAWLRHPVKHLNGTNYDVSKGQSLLRKVLESERLFYRDESERYEA